MTEHSYTTDGTEFQQLLSLGFSEDEAIRLIHLRNHKSEQGEYRELIEESRRLHFLRWLIDHDRISQ